LDSRIVVGAVKQARDVPGRILADKTASREAGHAVAVHGLEQSAVFPGGSGIRDELAVAETRYDAVRRAGPDAAARRCRIT
jgi:hypothetical protein